MGVCDKIKSELQDEIKARDEYTDLAREADQAGMYEVASSLRGIADDEARHRAILGGIINEPGRCMMPQDPNIPKLKISESCKEQIKPLVGVLEELITATSYFRKVRTYVDLGYMSAQAIIAADLLKEAVGKGVIDKDELDNILGALTKLPSGGIPFSVDEVLAARSAIKEAVSLTLDALLNAAVDCECREAKAAYEHLSSEALQTVIEGKGEHDGRPRRYTEIPGEE